MKKGTREDPNSACSRPHVTNNSDTQKEFYNERFSVYMAKQPECGNVEGSVSYFESFDISKEAKILDVGTYIGTFPYRIHAAGWKDVYGVDIGDVSITHGQGKYEAIQDRLIAYDGSRIPFPDGLFDVVTMFNVIEHIPNVHSFLVEAARVMKSGGLILLQTPNKPIDMIYETLKYRSFQWRRSHCSLQTVALMKWNLEKSGFCEVRFWKADMATDYYRGKAQKYAGHLGALAIPVLARFPLSLFPTLSASANKR